MDKCSVTPQKIKSEIPTIAVVPEGYVLDAEYPDETARLAHDLMLKTATTKERRKQGHFIPYSSDTWRKKFGGNYKDIKNAAVLSGLIDVNERYCTGMAGRKAFCKSIRLRDEHRTGKFRVVTLENPPTEKQKNSLSLERLEQVGVDLASRMAHFVLPSDVPPKNPWEALTINRIRHHDFYFTRCDFGRFHSSFTSLSKTTRFQLTTHSKEQLSSLDIRNAQPLIIGFQAREQTKQIGIPICCIRNDIEDWVSLCERGQVYEFVKKELVKNPVEPFFVTVKKSNRKFLVDPSTWEVGHVKKAFIACLFDQVESMRQNPVYNVIERCFPCVADYIVRTKSNGYGYKELAHTCQRTESRLMIAGVAAEYISRHPESPILTIHDELIVDASHEDEVSDLIKSVFLRHEVVPSVKAKKLGANECMN